MWPTVWGVAANFLENLWATDIMYACLRMSGELEQLTHANGSSKQV